MPIAARTRDLVIVSFVTLSIGFATGWWMGRESGGPTDPVTAATGGAPHPVGAEEYLQLGMQALGAGDFAGAEARFRQAVERRPDQAAPHADLAVALMYQEKWDAAHGELERAKQLDPDMPEIYFLEGVVHRDARGDTAQARSSWDRFLTMVPADSPQAQTVRGWLIELEGGGAPVDTTAAAPRSEDGVATPTGAR